MLPSRDGRISCAESCCIGCLGILTGAAGIFDVTTLIWVRRGGNQLARLFQGSVVVFGSWPNWTSDDESSEDYCKATPMMFAFILQVWT
jgi:hypothetical protein